MAGKRTMKRRSKKAIMTIPQLRKAFEHVETYVEIHCKKPEKELVKMFQSEWKKTFKKEIDTKEAEAYIAHALEEIHRKHPKDRKHSGGAMALSGAPLLHDTRPGLYISPGVNEGSYAQVPAYVDKGFWNPEIGRQYDPVPGQTRYPDATPYGLGSNRFVGGKRSKTRKQLKRNQQEGGSLTSAVNQFFMRPITSYSSPPNVIENTVSAAYAKPLPPGPEPTQVGFAYQSNLTGAGMRHNADPIQSTASIIPKSGTGSGWV
jgi:hypothetical protein